MKAQVMGTRSPGISGKENKGRSQHQEIDVDELLGGSRSKASPGTSFSVYCNVLSNLTRRQLTYTFVYLLGVRMQYLPVRLEIIMDPAWPTRRISVLLESEAR
jgi:hypothetical protein